MVVPNLRVEALACDLDLVLTLGPQQLLAGLLAALDPEGAVLFLQLRERAGELVEVGLAGGLDGDRQGRLRVLDGRHRQGRLLARERVAGDGVGQLGHGPDLTGADLVDRLLLGALDVEDLRDALVLALLRVPDGVVRLDAARPHAEVGESTHEGVGRGLEDLRHQRAVRVGCDLDLVTAVVGGLDRRLLERRGQVADDGVEHGAHAHVLVGRGHHHRRQHGVLDALVEAQLQLLVADGLALEELHEHVVVGVGRGLEQLLAAAGHLVDHVLGDGHFLALAVLVAIGLAVDEVHVAGEGLALADGDLDGRDLAAELVAQGVEGGHGVGVLALAAGDDEDGRGVGRARQAHGRLGAGLDAAGGVDGDERAISRREAADDLPHEVRVAWRVDERDVAAVTIEGVGRERERQLALLLLGLEVERGGAVVDTAHAVDDAGLVEQVLGDGGLSGPCMSGQDDVAES